MKTLFLRSLFILGALSLVTALRANAVVVGNPSLASQSLDADGVKAVLTGKRVTLGDARVVIVIIKASDTQEAFLKERVGMTTSQFQTHWRRLFMTGGGSAPKIVENEAEAVKLVSETAGAVAIVDSGKVGSLPVLAGK